MNPKRRTGKDESERPATLGDLLYADKGRHRVPEEEWVRLVRAIASGDQSALQSLFERSHRIVFTLMMRLTGSPQTAEELTIDVFHEVWRRASAYDPADGSVLGWILNQARSRAIDRMRFDQRKKRVDPCPDSPGPSIDPKTTEELLDTELQARTLREALSGLTTQERQALEIAFFAGLTHAEIAQKLNEPLGTIKTRIRSALQKLRQLMPEKDGRA